ncbi:MAG TPA: hypothetical protein VER11_19100 [Polyangiaceae bacterium]|nr:hypothetical protein [Polyangiaceae bacterium]
MTSVGLRAIFGLALLVAIGACEGGEVVIFSPAQAGAAGNDAGAGASGAAFAGAGGSSAGLAGQGGSTAGGSGGTGGGTSCRSNADCGLSWFCQKPDCTAATGVCLPLPISEESRYMPVCGCEDNITYWNDTQRQLAGISASTPGQCQSASAKTCMSSVECGPYGACRQVLPGPNDCGSPPGVGQCWAIPDNCTSPDDKPVGLPCPPPGPPSGCPPILTACQALQADRPYIKLPRNYHCP